MALLHNSLSGGPTPVSDVNEVPSDEQGIHRYGADDLILYALGGELCETSCCFFVFPLISEKSETDMDH